MAHAESLPNDVLEAVAEQIGAILPGVADSADLRDAQVTMGETFELWALGADAITQPINDLNQLATQTGRWHHQVAYRGEIGSFARSAPLGAEPSSWRVAEFFESPLAKKIDEAINWIDQNTDMDPLVRLLVVPAYQLHAFWLLDAENVQVFVIDCPSQFTYLRSGYLFSQDEFLQSLRQEHHIIGRYRS